MSDSCWGVHESWLAGGVLPSAQEQTPTPALTQAQGMQECDVPAPPSQPRAQTGKERDTLSMLGEVVLCRGEWPCAEEGSLGGSVPRRLRLGAKGNLLGKHWSRCQPPPRRGWGAAVRQTHTYFPLPIAKKALETRGRLEKPCFKHRNLVAKDLISHCL